MFTNILVPLDGSPLAETAIPHVVAVAGAYPAQVVLLRVLDPERDPAGRASLDPLEWQIAKAEAESYLEKLAGRLGDIGLRTRLQIMEGNAAESVLKYARDNASDLIILSSHGQSGISGWNVSGVVQKIILRARTSVMIERAYHPFGGEWDELHYRRILLPLDGSRRAEAVLPVAATLARHHHAELLVAHVARKPEMPRRIPLPQEDQELVERIVERNRLEATRYLDQLKSQMDLPLQTRLLVSDRILAALHDLVEEAEADLVFLSAHGYSGGTKWPYGSTVISFIAYGTTPLLIYQDLPSDHMEASQVEEIAKESGGR